MVGKAEVFLESSTWGKSLWPYLKDSKDEIKTIQLIQHSNIYLMFLIRIQGLKSKPAVSYMIDNNISSTKAHCLFQFR